MVTEIKIRKGKISDIPQLIKLYSGVKEIADFSGQIHDKGYFTAYIKSKSAVLLVADKNGKICGALNAEFVDLSKYTFLDNVIVSPEQRGRGVCGMLMSALEALSKKRKNKRSIALVYEWNTHMHEILLHYNYAPTGKTVIYSKEI